MRLGLLSDVHGNSIALDACLPKLQELSVDRCFFLGDVVGYMPDGEGCIERLDAEGIECQKGNHEAMLLGEIPVPEGNDEVYRLDDSRTGLANGRLDQLAGWPERREIELGGRRILLVHGSPDDPLSGYFYPDSDLERFRSLPFDLIVTANTHRPFTRNLDEMVFANSGSVGLPRDVGDLSSFGVYDTADGDFALYRVRFGVDRVLEGLRGQIHHSVGECMRRSEPEWEGELLS